MTNFAHQFGDVCRIGPFVLLGCFNVTEKAERLLVTSAFKGNQWRWLDAFQIRRPWNADVESA